MNDEEASSLPLGTMAVTLCVAGMLGAASVLDALPAFVGTLAGALLFFGAGALGPLVRASPVVPSALKLLTLSMLASPVLASAAYVVLHAGLDARLAVATTFVLLGALQLLALGKRVALVPLGPGARGALVLSLLCAVLVVAFVFRGSAARASYHGLLHSALVLAVDRSVPPDNPWMAGTALGYYWYWHAMGALVVRGLAIAPTTALAAIDLWAAAVLPLALYFAVAPLWRNGKRELGGVTLALFGLSALGGWLWLARGAPWQAPQVSLDVLGVLAAAVGDWDPRLAFGFSKFGNLSSYPAALALLAGGWMCAAHAIRAAARPWVGATALMHGAALVVNPVVGGVGIAGTGVAVLACARGLRLRLLVPLVVGALPGLALVAIAGRAYAGDAVGFAVEPARFWRALAPVLLLAVPACFASLDVDAEDLTGRRRIRVLLLASALVPLALYLVVRLPYQNEYKLVRIAALPLGCLAAGGVARLLSGHAALRAFGALVALTLVVGVGANNVLGARTYASFAERELPLAEHAVALAPAPASHPWLPRAYAVLRAASDGAAPPPVLLVDLADPGASPVYAARAGEHRFTEPLRNLQGHEAAAFAGIALFCDRPSQALDARTPGWRERIELATRVFHGAGAATPADRAALAVDGRPLVALVTGRATARTAERLASFGLERVWAPAGPDDPAGVYAGSSAFGHKLGAAFAGGAP